MGGLKNEPIQNHQQIRLQGYLGLLIGPRSQVGRHRQSGGIMNPCDKPMAAAGLISYRYKGRYGWIMIGARNHADALNEAQRSTSDKVNQDNLQVWNGTQYTEAV